MSLESLLNSTTGFVHNDGNFLLPVDFRRELPVAWGKHLRTSESPRNPHAIPSHRHWPLIVQLAAQRATKEDGLS